MAFPGRFYRDGGLLKQENIAGNLRLFFVEQFGFNHFFNDEIFKWIDALADSGVNGMRVFGFWPFGNGQEEEPYVKTGATYDLNQFNDRFFEYQQNWVAYAEECGIAVLYELFDTCGITQASVAPHHPFYQLVGGSANAFADVNNTALLDENNRVPFGTAAAGLFNRTLDQDKKGALNALARRSANSGRSLHSGRNRPAIFLCFSSRSIPGPLRCASSSVSCSANMRTCSHRSASVSFMARAIVSLDAT